MQITVMEDVDLVPTGSLVPRSDNRLHVTQLIREIEEDLGRNKYSNNSSDFAWDRELGFIWEEVLSYHLGERLGARIGEVELDGIVGSPDGVQLSEDGELILEEYKCTKRSINSDPSDNWYWMTQIKAYCKLLNARECHLYVLYLNGDYKADRRIIPVPYRIVFTQDEIDRTWKALKKKAAELMKKETDNYEYEERKAKLT